VLADGTDRYLYGMGRIAQQTPNGWQYFLPDALGSVRQLTDAAGTLALTQSFDPYGGLLPSQGSAATPYGFAGEWSDPGGLIYLRARYYTPHTGRFTSLDTWIGDLTAPGSLNRYVYARNNPLRYIDPTGHNVWDTIGEFSTGMVYEFAWASSWVSPQRPWILAPSGCESVARLAGRSVGDILAILVGLDWIGSGAGGIGAGFTMCGTGVLCPAGVGVVAVSWAAVAVGGVLTIGGAIGLGQNLALLSGKNDEIKNTYPGKRSHPDWPKEFQTDHLLKENVKNSGLLRQLRRIESGKWQKVYENGWINGEQVTIHYFQAPSGRVFDLEVHYGYWSNR